MNIQRVHMIINPASDQDRPILHVENRVFARYKIEWDATFTHRSGDATQFARELAKRNDIEMLMCYGGDGTIRDVVNGLVGSDMPLGILGGGTGNAVATELRISPFLEVALEAICTGDGELHAIDVGKINDGYFLLRADT